MILTLFRHELRRGIRSSSAGRETVSRILVGVLGLLVLFYLLVLGFALDDIIIKGLGQKDPLGFVHSLLIYYLISEFVSRYLLQNVPVLLIDHYLHLPVRRRALAAFILVRSLFNAMNIWVLILFAPFSFQFIAPIYGTAAAVTWIAAMWVLSLIIHYVVLIYKLRLDDTSLGLAILAVVTGFFSLSDYFGWFRLTDVSRTLFSFMTEPWAMVPPSVVLLLLVFMVYRILIAGLYREELVKRSDPGTPAAANLAFLQRFGVIGAFIDLELKLILRNKRTRTILYLTIVFLLYGLLFYPKEEYTSGSFYFLIFIGIFVTAPFMINYGQYLFSWQGGHFDFILTRPVSIRLYLESRYWLLATSSAICFVLTVPYVYFGWKILLLNTSLVLYNIGVNLVMMINFAMWQPKRLDLSKGGGFNVDGAGAAQWLMGIPMMFGPMLIYLPFALTGNDVAGVILLGVLGLLGILFRNSLLGWTASRLSARQHAIAAGFRKD